MAFVHLMPSGRFTPQSSLGSALVESPCLSGPCLPVKHAFSRPWALQQRGPGVGVDRGTSVWDGTEPVTSSLPTPPIFSVLLLLVYTLPHTSNFFSCQF